MLETVKSKGAVLRAAAVFCGLLVLLPVSAAAAEGRAAGQAARVQEQGPGEEGQEVSLPEPAPLSEEHEKWLEEDVVYIISPMEKAAFEMLASDGERDLFIEAFWRARDPTPGTFRNEALEEHERRIEYANRRLGRESPREGWRSDMGRIYIQLGEPEDIIRHVDPRQFWPMEIWHYQADPRATDLPAFFYVMFFQPERSGEFRMYDPHSDGPRALAKQISLQMANEPVIVQTLLQSVGYEAAIASLTMDLGERADFTGASPSPRTAFVVAAIEEAPYAEVDQRYAMRFAEHRGNVEADVAFATLPIEVSAMSFWDERGVPFLHYAVEIPPEGILLGEYESDYYLSLNIGHEVTDLHGREVASDVQQLEQHFDEARARGIASRPLAYYDRVDLIPGIYDTSFTVQNPISGDRSTAHVRTVVPAPNESDWVFSELLVASSSVPLNEVDRRGTPRPFRFAGEQFLPLLGDVIPANETVVVFAQVVAPAGADPTATLTSRASMMDAEGNEHAVVFGAVRQPLQGPQPTPIRVTLPLTDVPGGEFWLRLTVGLPNSTSRTLERKIVVLPGAEALVTPEVMLADEARPGELQEYRTRGMQHVRKGELASAEAMYRAGLSLDPDSVSMRRALAQLLMEREDYPGVVEQVRELARRGVAMPADALMQSRALRLNGQARDAVEVARVVLQRWTPTTVAWNEYAEALLAFGDVAAAADAYRSSLLLDPDQPEVEAALARIKGQ
jgi:GWxTD domain-containing protein